MILRCVFGLLCVGLCSAARLHAASLHIDASRGSGLNNRVGVRGQAPVVRVTDDAGKPVAGALVVFTAPSAGPSVDFGNGPTAQASTDQSGVASAPVAKPVGGNGPVRIEVLAEKDGAVANAAIDEMNLGFSSADVAGDMEIARMPDPVPPREAAAKRVVRVRVTDAAGAPVAGAELKLRLSLKTSVMELASQSRADGTADFQADPKILKGLNEVPVTAVAHGVTSTRIIAIGQSVP